MDNGNRIVLSTINDSVGIGTNTPTKKFEVIGDGHIHGNLSWLAKTGYVSVPAAAFDIGADYGSYINNGNAVWGTDGFLAPVYLPHGATVTRVTFFWMDDNALDEGRLSLTRSYMNGAGGGMAIVYTSGDSPTSDSSFTESISFDARLWKHDIEGSIAHVKMLAKQKIISSRESVSIVKGLNEIAKEIASGKFRFRESLEITKETDNA